MARAIQLAKKGQYTTHPNPRVGCVIVKNNKTIGEGFHQRAGYPHAEINAIHAATESLQNATAYVTLEPCSHTGKTPPCVDALIESGISRVVIAMQDPNPQVAGKGIKKLREAGIDVEIGIFKLIVQSRARFSNQVHLLVRIRCDLIGPVGMEPVMVIVSPGIGDVFEIVVVARGNKGLAPELDGELGGKDQVHTK